MTSRNNLKDFGNKRVTDLIKESLNSFTTDDLRVAVPAVVIRNSDYETLQCVDVKPLISEVYEDGVTLQAPVIKKVFVKLQHGNGFSIKMPITVGDLVTLQYSHKDLGKLLDSDSGEVTQERSLSAEERDCWVEHGFGTRKNHQSPSKDNLVIEGDNTVITITPSGNITAVTSGTSYIKSSGHTIDAPTTHITGDATIDGSLDVGVEITTPVINATDSLTIDGTEVRNHVHGGVERGGSNTDPL